MPLHGRKNLPVGSSISSSAGAPVIHGDAADKAVRLLRARRERPRRRAAAPPSGRARVWKGWFHMARTITWATRIAPSVDRLVGAAVHHSQGGS
jgi:hypothetical protein